MPPPLDPTFILEIINWEINADMIELLKNVNSKYLYNVLLLLGIVHFRHAIDNLH